MASASESSANSEVGLRPNHYVWCAEPRPRTGSISVEDTSAAPPQGLDRGCYLSMDRPVLVGAAGCAHPDLPVGESHRPGRGARRRSGASASRSRRGLIAMACSRAWSSRVWAACWAPVRAVAVCRVRIASSRVGTTPGGRGRCWSSSAGSVVRWTWLACEQDDERSRCKTWRARPWPWPLPQAAVHRSLLRRRSKSNGQIRSTGVSPATKRRTPEATRSASAPLDPSWTNATSRSPRSRAPHHRDDRTTRRRPAPSAPWPRGRTPAWPRPDG